MQRISLHAFFALFFRVPSRVFQYNLDFRLQEAGGRKQLKDGLCPYPFKKQYINEISCSSDEFVSIRIRCGRRSTQTLKPASCWLPAKFYFIGLMPDEVEFNPLYYFYFFDIIGVSFGKGRLYGRYFSKSESRK